VCSFRPPRPFASGLGDEVVRREQLAAADKAAGVQGFVGSPPVQDADMTWVLFDLNGTLLDPHTIDRALPDGNGVASKVLGTAVLFSMALAHVSEYRPFADLVRSALRRELELAAQRRAHQIGERPVLGDVRECHREQHRRSEHLRRNPVPVRQRAVDGVRVEQRPVQVEQHPGHIRILHRGRTDETLNPGSLVCGGQLLTPDDLVAEARGKRARRAE